MNKEKIELIEAINAYDENSTDSFDRLKTILCSISDKIGNQEKDFFLESLLYLAAQKMRVFGYNRMNKFETKYGEELGMSDFQVFSNEIIEASYTSSSETLLDYHQMEVLNIYDSLEHRKMILSAPTSFGKTRLLREIIFKYRYKKIILIFPTNALLFENYSELLKFNQEYDLGYQIVNNSNIKELDGEKFIFVLTPERYLKLRGDHTNLKIDFFFMDEVYKIDNFFTSEENDIEDDRDKVFRIVLYMLAYEVNDYYLAGPYMNLKKLGSGLEIFVNKNNIKLVHVQQELVLKNIINCWKDDIIINEIKLKYFKDKSKTTINLVAKIIENNQGSILIYCDSKNTVDTLANKLTDACVQSAQSNQRLKKFIDHLEHRYDFYDGSRKIDWSVKKHIKGNISVHYGSLPKYIQTEMLKLFNENCVNVILSTTSITEGVNTNAKNLIFYGTTKGGKELKVFDVKNIIGRAGRYYHHFVGNIYLFDEQIAQKNSSDESEELDFITFTDKKISNVDIDNTLIKDLIGDNKKIKEDRESIINEYDIPSSVLNQNRTVDWLKQIKLYKIIDSKNDEQLRNYRSKTESLENFIAKDNHSLEEMFNDLLKAEIIEEYEFKMYPAIAKTYSFLGFRGLISYEIKAKKDIKRKNNRSIILTDREYDTCYRSVFNKMNNIIEYKVPKYISLYSSIFVYVCMQRGLEIKREVIDTIINYYETGVFTYIGSYLSNRGYPNITIKDLEKECSYEMNLDIDTFRYKYRTKDLKIFSLLDDYEMNLLGELLDLD